MAITNFTGSRPIGTAAMRRHAREARVTLHLYTLTGALRALSGSGATLAHAARVRDRYGRAIGVAEGAGGRAFLDFLLSDESAGVAAEDIDSMLNHLDADPIDAARHGACAIRQAMLRGVTA